MDRAGVAAAELGELARQVERLLTLEDVVRWNLACSPGRRLPGVVVQDEYTHDVVIEWTHGRYLVFDTT